MKILCQPNFFLKFKSEYSIISERFIIKVFKYLLKQCYNLLYFVTCKLIYNCKIPAIINNTLFSEDYFKNNKYFNYSFNSIKIVYSSCTEVKY
jgi:hypothetical protein